MKDLQIWDPIMGFAKWWDDNAPRSRQSLIGINSMPVQVEEQEGKIVVKAKISGVKKEEIDLTVNQDSTTISIRKTTEEKQGKKGTVHYTEFYQEEQISRTISLPASVDTAKVDAELKDGMLIISAPTLASAQERKVQIK